MTRSLKGKYRSAMNSGYYPPMSYDEWLYNIEGVVADNNMEIDVTIYLENEEKEDEPTEIKKTYSVCASDDDSNSLFYYARNAVKEDFPEYLDIEVANHRWL